MATMTVKNASGADEVVEKPLAPGRAAAAASRPVALSTEDKAAIDAVLAKLSADPATQATLAAVLAKLPASPATAALQADANTLLTTLAGYLDGVETLIGATNALLAAATPAGELHIGEIGGNSAIAGVTITRPANTTAYAAGQLVSFNTVAATVNATPTAITAARKNAGTGVIRRIRLSTNKPALTGFEVFRVHLFKSAPTVANGDGGALQVNGVGAIALGDFDITLTRVFNDGAKGYLATDIVFDAGAGTQQIFALLEARGAYTPASGEVFTIALELLRD